MTHPKDAITNISRLTSAHCNVIQGQLRRQQIDLNLCGKSLRISRLSSASIAVGHFILSHSKTQPLGYTVFHSGSLPPPAIISYSNQSNQGDGNIKQTNGYFLSMFEFLVSASSSRQACTTLSWIADPELMLSMGCYA